MGSANPASGAIRATGLAMLSMLALLSAILVAENYTAERSKAAIAAHRAAHVVATQFGWVLETGAHVLDRIESGQPRLDLPRFDLPRRDGPATDMGDGGFQAADSRFVGLGAAVRDLPAGMEYGVFSPKGRLRLASKPERLPQEIAGLAAFQRLRAGERQVIIPMLDSPTDPDAVFLMGRRLGEGAAFRGVAVVAMPVSMLKSLADTLGFLDGSTVSLVAADGMVIARSPPIRPMDLSKTALFDALADSASGVYDTISPADGVARIVGYWTLPDWPVIAIAARDRSTALEGFWRNLGLAAVLALPILFGVGWLIHDLLNLLALDERRRAALAAAHERTNFLLREIHHRVKNNLSTVTGLIRLERLPDEVKDRLQGRIRAMVSVHEAMYLSDEFRDICIRPHLGRLLEDVARGWGLEVALRVDIPPLRLSGARAMLLGLLTNELVSSAFKHAFARRGGGCLWVRIEACGDGSGSASADWVRLTVADDGPGYSADRQPAQMGSRLIEAFAAQLGGRVHVESDGRTVVTVDFPRHYGEDAEPAPETVPESVLNPAPVAVTDQPRPAQSGSVSGSRSMKDILLSIQGRFSNRI